MLFKRTAVPAVLISRVFRSVTEASAGAPLLFFQKILIEICRGVAKEPRHAAADTVAVSVIMRFLEDTVPGAADTMTVRVIVVCAAEEAFPAGPHTVALGIVMHRIAKKTRAGAADLLTVLVVINGIPKPAFSAGDFLLRHR